MNFKHRLQIWCVLLLAPVVFSGCASCSSWRSNLYFHKQELIRYHDSGKYDAEVKRIADRAMSFIRNRAASGETNLAVVLDMDDTAVSTWDRLLKDDFGRKDWMFVHWATNNFATPIPPMLELYRETKKLGVKVFFITGRRPQLAGRTEENLKIAGFVDHDGLHLRPADDLTKSLVPFKAGTRKKISGQGLKIIANIGDQQSDLDGGYSERTFKLPNPFYYTP